MEVPARTLPVPGTVSPEVQKLIAAPLRPNWNLLPKTGEEWKPVAEAGAAATIRNLPALAERCGVYHMSSTGSATWFDFARAIVGDVAHPRVTPIATAEYPTPARRPACGLLDTAKFERTFGFALPPWRVALTQCVESPAEPDPMQ